MRPGDQRIAIAQACGWTKIHGTHLVGYPSTGAGDYFVSVPDYLTDLNAMHEAEKVLTDSQLVGFRIHLIRNSDGPSVEAAMCHATAAQRAEAFLKTLNLWKE